MLFTAWTILIFLLIGVAAVGLGHFSGHIEMYFFGALIMLFMGLFILSNGVSEKVGEYILMNESVVDNVTSSVQSVDFVFDSNINIWTNGLGLLCVIIAAGLGLTWRSEKKKKDRERKLSIDLEE